jgi:hypothetical protein
MLFIKVSHALLRSRSASIAYAMFAGRACGQVGNLQAQCDLLLRCCTFIIWQQVLFVLVSTVHEHSHTC